MKSNKVVMIFLFCLTGSTVRSQTTVQEAIAEGKKNNPSLRVAALEKEYQSHIRSSAGYIGKTEINLLAGQYNSYKWGDNNFTISQKIPNPKNFSSQRLLGDELIRSAEIRENLTASELSFSIKKVYYELLYMQARQRLLKQQDSIYSEFLKAASLRFKTGETNLLEQTTAETSLYEVRNQVNQNAAEIRSYYYHLHQLTGNDSLVVLEEDSLSERTLSFITDSADITGNPQLQFFRQQINVLRKERDVVAAQRLPDFTLGYFNQSLIGNPLDDNSVRLATGGNRFMGINAGISLSIFNRPMRSKIKASEVNTRIAETRLIYNRDILMSEWNQVMEEYKKNLASVEYYRSSALPTAALLLKQARNGYREGDTGYAPYLLAIRSALQIRENYLLSLGQLNQSVIHLEYLTGTAN